jgi:hypothetical protein
LDAEFGQSTWNSVSKCSYWVYHVHPCRSRLDPTAKGLFSTYFFWPQKVAVALAALESQLRAEVQVPQWDAGHLQS